MFRFEVLHVLFGKEHYIVRHAWFATSNPRATFMVLSGDQENIGTVAALVTSAPKSRLGVDLQPKMRFVEIFESVPFLFGKPLIYRQV
ncbi:MAG TPA: hypothetical protein VGG85_07790 [Terracidiphilus sp.]|jgi:hypothetical protein